MNKKVIMFSIATLILIGADFSYHFYPHLSLNAPTVLVQASPLPGPASPLNPLEYQAYLDSLDRSDLQSLVNGVKVLERNIPNYSLAEADQAFLAFNTFYIESLNYCNETFWQNESLNSKLRAAIQGLSPTQVNEYLNIPSSLQKDREIKNFVQQISDGGLILTASEGGFYLSENPDFLYNRFSQYLSPSLRAFLELRRQETAEGFIGNHGLEISFAKIGERVIRWEKYNDQYPDSPLGDLADYQYQMYLGVFLFGIDTSKVFEDKRLKPEFRKVYENFKQLYANTKTANLVSRYYDVLSANDFIYNEAVEKFLHDNHVPILPGLQP